MLVWFVNDGKHLIQFSQEKYYKVYLFLGVDVVTIILMLYIHIYGHIYTYNTYKHIYNIYLHMNNPNYMYPTCENEETYKFWALENGMVLSFLCVEIYCLLVFQKSCLNNVFWLFIIILWQGDIITFDEVERGPSIHCSA